MFGSLMGLGFPVCECGVVPLVRRLFRKGLPVPAGIAFLLAAPIINPIVILSTATAFGFGKMLLLRISFTILISFIVGLVFTVVSTPWDILKPTLWIIPKTCDHQDHHHEEELPAGRSTPTQKIVSVFQVALDEFFEMGRYLVLGALIAAGLQTFIPQSILLNIGSGPLTSVLVMMGLAILLSICSTVDSFVALGFVGIFSTGSVLSFLLYGPMVDIKSILMFSRVFRPRTVVYMVVIPFMLVLLIGVSLNTFSGW
ncbi:MAG: permease [Anaerolineaceae bacterium]